MSLHCKSNNENKTFIDVYRTLTLNFTANKGYPGKKFYYPAVSGFSNIPVGRLYRQGIFKRKKSVIKALYITYFTPKIFLDYGICIYLAIDCFRGF